MAKSKGSKPGKEVPVELGFVEEVDETWKLASPFFVSKFGGSPAWLDLRNLPEPKELQCGSCGGPPKFLMQVYAPLETAETFHRTIFLFVCTKDHCCKERNSNKNWIVLRCQLPKENEFYSANPPEYSMTLVAEHCPEKFGAKLCRICGCLGPLSCGGCHKVSYCCKDHQTVDWKGGHKAECTDADFKPTEDNRRRVGKYSELEIVIDTEVIPKSKGKEKTEQEKLKEFEKLVAEGQTGTMSDAPTTDLEAASYISDKTFNKFRKRVKYHPDQILRYDRGGEPLWVSSEESAVLKEVPVCSYCKGDVKFEFQVMPQLLNNVGRDAVEGSLDWGTVAIYTCQNSCNEGPAYKKEFAWQQDFVNTDI